MKIKTRAFPHPVVGNGDDVDAEFQVAIDPPTSDGTNYAIAIDILTNSETLKQLIKQKKAVFSLHVESSSTMYRKHFDFTTYKKTVRIPIDHLAGVVEINVVARAKKSIPQYKVKRTHADFGSANFRIDPGDILALAEYRTFDTDIDDNAIEQVSSVFEVRPSEDGTIMRVELGRDVIRITLPKGDFDSYKALRNSTAMATIVNSSVVLPALTEAVTMVKSASDEFEDNLWCRVIRRKLESESIDLEQSALEVAQHLLEHPLRRSLESGVVMLEDLNNG